LKLLRCN
ncbi:'Cold-shock' DNA-binding domain protein, partial [Vibrio cholerae HC-62B1]